jgi:hypothetical protein
MLGTLWPPGHQREELLAGQPCGGEKSPIASCGLANSTQVRAILIDIVRQGAQQDVALSKLASRLDDPKRPFGQEEEGRPAGRPSHYATALAA